jgi:chromosome segregation ATPase
MNEPQTFRSAFNGFHREDVVNHIAYMTTKHETLVKELRSENDTLRTELEGLRARLDDDTAAQDRAAELEQALEGKDAELNSVREELETANQLLNEQAEQLAALREELEEAREAAAKPAAIEKSANHWDELRAYRRAETAERQAKERVNDLYTSANTALRGAGATLGDTNAAFEALAEKFRADLVELMNAIETGRTALTTAADTLDTLRPEETE